MSKDIPPKNQCQSGFSLLCKIKIRHAIGDGCIDSSNAHTKICSQGKTIVGRVEVCSRLNFKVVGTSRKGGQRRVVDPQISK